MHKTLIQTSKGAMPVHMAIETDKAVQPWNTTKTERWEAIRSRANTIGARCALDEAIRREEGGR